MAVAIAAPIIILFWWARRHAPVGDYDVDYSVSRRTRPPADTVVAMPAPAVHGPADAPVPANPALLAPPTEAAEPPASTVSLPAQAPLPPEPASVQTPAPAPVKAAEHPVPAAVAPAAVPEPPKPAPVPVAKAESTPAPAKAPIPAKAPVTVEVPKPAYKPEPPAAAAPVVPEKVAPAPPREPEPAPVERAATAPAAAQPAGESDDFSRLYGPDAAAIAALHGAGILTYRQLAAASIDSLKEILSAAGVSGIDPSTWPQQGRFAAGGKWKILDARFKS